MTSLHENANNPDTTKNLEFIGPLMLDVKGLSLTDHEKTILFNPLVGGLILFSRNFQSLEQLEALVSDVRDVSPNLIIAVDHEGGRVQRFRKGFTRVPAMAALGALYKNDPVAALEKAKDFAWLIASELLAYDIDLSFAPVLDRDYGISSVIGDRAFSESSDDIIALATAFIKGMHEGGMVSTGKHFPGHGGVAADSHLDIPVDPRSFSTLQQDDMCIFSALAKNGLDAIMPAHVIYPEIDNQPAGFSSIWLQDILRQDLGFEGVIFSDDLAMEGATVAGSFSQRADAALSAGCDMVLVCNHPEGAEEVLRFLEQQQYKGVRDFVNPRLNKMKYNKQLKMSVENLKKSERWIKLQGETTV